MAEFGVQIGSANARANAQPPLDVDQLRLVHSGWVCPLIHARLLAGEFLVDGRPAEAELPGEGGHRPPKTAKGFQLHVGFSRLQGGVSCCDVDINTHRLAGDLFADDDSERSGLSPGSVQIS